MTLLKEASIDTTSKKNFCLENNFSDFVKILIFNDYKQNVLFLFILLNYIKREADIFQCLGRTCKNLNPDLT